MVAPRSSADPSGLDFEGLFGQARMGPYLQFAGNDSAIAHRLYFWNIALSVRYLGQISLIEVGLRNLLDHSMCKITQSDRWWNTEQDRLSEKTVDNIHSTLQYLPNCHTADEFIGASSFGLWTTLLHKDNAREFSHLASDAFGDKRGPVYRVMSDVKRLRDRAAHHKPIFQESHETHLQNLKKAMEYVAWDMAEFVDRVSDLEEVIQAYNHFSRGKCYI